MVNEELALGGGGKGGGGPRKRHNTPLPPPPPSRVFIEHVLIPFNTPMNITFPNIPNTFPWGWECLFRSSARGWGWGGETYI